MDRTLATFAAGAAPLAARLRVARDLARAVAALHARGGVHGALSPSSVLVAGAGEAVALAPPGAPAPLDLAGWAAPEVLRGGRRSRQADAFAAGALARLALTGRGPYDGGGADGLERARRVLFEAPRPARLDVPAVPAEVDEVLARLLERRARRRARPEELARAIEAVIGEREGSTASAMPLPRPSTPVATPTAIATANVNANVNAPSAAATAARAAVRLVRSIPGAAATAVGSFVRHVPRLPLAALARRIPPSPLHRAALAAVPLLVVALAFLPRSDASLAREVEAALGRGDVAAARAALDAAPRSADRALVDKLRGDVACARRAPGECLRRYRTALAARSTLRGDEVLRRNLRALVSRDESCDTRRGAALLLGELRDPDALPALEAARRSSGFFGFLCTGDAFDRAIAATRAPAR